MTNGLGDHLRGRRVLIVEDDYFVAADLAEALQELGAIVLGPSGSVKDALRQISSDGAPDAAVLDINLGQEKAYPIADALLARRIPFIFTTGYSGDALPVQYGKIPRCQKPVQMAAVARLLVQGLSA